MAVKEFVTAAKATEGEETGVLGSDLVVTVDGREILFFAPTEGQLALFMAGASDSTSQVGSIASTINFFFSLLDDENVRYFKVRLFDRRDPFSAVDVVDIVEYLVGEWSARPTKQPSDYMPSQSSTGQRSTARRHRTA